MDSEIQQYAGDILAHPRFEQLRTFCQHGLDNSVYDHSVAVAEAACQIARLMRLSESETTSVVRAALLHDFFGYDWHGERFRRYLSHFSGVHRIAHIKSTRSPLCLLEIGFLLFVDGVDDGFHFVH